MALARFAALTTILCAGSLAFACSSPDPGGPVRAYQPAAQATGTATGTPAPTQSGTQTPKTPEDRPPDQGADAGATSLDAGAPQDSGVGNAKDSSAAPAPLGSCSNPACGSGAGQCGCRGTDNTAPAVYLGCNAGGACACFQSQAAQGSAFAENGACDDPAALKALFLTNCACP